MILWILVLVGLAFFYALCLFWLVCGLLRTPKSPHLSSETPTVSVIVAARNEEENIAECLNCLCRQQYSKDKLEIIIVDDRSADGTAKIVRDFSAHYAIVKLLQIDSLPRNMTPKKHALDTGIRNARGEIIVLTDADCRPGPRWVSGMIGHFNADTGLVAGFAPLVSGPESLLCKKLLELDSLALAAISAGSFGMGFPLTCTGRNLAYRKNLYEQVRGFESIAEFISGDDDLFLHLVRDAAKWKMRYSLDKNTFVNCAGPATVREFFAQRTRHASKGLHYETRLRLALCLVYLFNLALFIGPPLSLIGAAALQPFLYAFLCKIACELGLLLYAGILLDRFALLRLFPLAALFHVPYVVFFAALGSGAKFTWKDARSSTRVPPKGDG